MDRKSLAGFILILLILFLWPVWSRLLSPGSKEVPPAPGKEALTAPETTGVVETPPAEIVQGLDTLKLTPQEPEKLVHIETEKFRAVLSSYGGVIKSFELLGYHVDNGANGDSSEGSHGLVQMVTGPEASPWQAPGGVTLGVDDSLSYLNHVAFAVEGEDHRLSKGAAPVVVSFVYHGPDGGMLRKDYTFHADVYTYDLRLSAENLPALGIVDRLTLSWLAPMLPTETDYKEDLGKFAGFYNMAGEVVEVKDIKSATGQSASGGNGELRLLATGSTQWVASRSKYFATAIIADDLLASEAVLVGVRDKIIDQQGRAFDWKQFGVGMTYYLRGNSFTNDFTIYSGPLDYFRLTKIGYNLAQLIDMGWKPFRPFAIGILWVFVQLYKFLFNYGVVIIVFSVLMKVVFWPLTRKSTLSMMKMKDLQPKLQELKAKYKDEPQKLQTETMKVYKAFGVNPFGSCLPLLIQLPIFWAMFSVLRNSIEMRAAGFAFWITDLSQKDPYYALPILMGIAMFLQQKMTITDPKQKMMVYIMPVVFVFLFAGWPSGLVLYWAMFSVIGIFEQLLIKRSLDLEKKPA